jgi:hypothetical protein
VLRRPLEFALRAVVGVVNQPGLRAPARDGHLERPLDELKAHVGEHAPADDQAAEAVDHRGEVQPPLPGGQVGDVRAPQAVRRRGIEVALDQVGRNPHARNAHGGAGLSRHRDALEPRLGDQPLDALAADADAVLKPQLGVDPGSAAGAVRGGVDLPDLRGQERVVQVAV